MRGQIELMVQSGRSDDEIKSIFVAKYGERVLALPEGVPRMWLFWTPVIVAAAGLMAVCSFLNRSRRCDNLPQDTWPSDRVK
jgi:cytochrome c-type biogenesis protein CcmH/NrfF